VPWVGVAPWHLPYQSDGQFHQSKTITVVVCLWHGQKGPCDLTRRRTSFSLRFY
jgi:hypothetical protein